MLLQRTDDEKVAKERMHLDLETDDVEAEVQRLEALGATRWDHQVEHGYDFWVRELFDDAGRARARDDRTYPLEAHSYATAIDTLVVLRERRPDGLALAARVADAAVRDLWLADRDHFAFERRPRFTNRRAFVRWTNAPMFRALSRLIAAQSE